MAYPNILAHRGNGTLQYLSAAELADLTELVLEKIAADGTVGCLTADVYAESGGEPYVINGYYPLYSTESAATAASASDYNMSHSHTFDGVTHYMPEGITNFHGNYIAGAPLGSSNLSTVGTFTNRYRRGVQSSADGTLIQNDVVLYQNLDINSVDVSERPHPVIWDSDLNSLQPANNGHLQDLCDEILSYITSADGPMSHKLSPTSPSGGTWAAVLTLGDTLARGANGTTEYVWMKMSGTRSHTVDCVCPDGQGLKHMTAEEVALLSEAVKSRMIATGVGTYSLSTSAPATGTWANCGSVTDRVNTFVPDQGNFVGLGAAVNYYGMRHYPFHGWSNDLFHRVFYGPTAMELGFSRAYHGIYPTNYSSWSVPGVYSPPSQFASYMGWSVDTGVDDWESPGRPGGTTSYYARYVSMSYPAYTSYRYQSYTSDSRVFYGNYPTAFSGNPPTSYSGDAISSGTETVSTQTLWRRVG